MFSSQKPLIFFWYCSPINKLDSPHIRHVVKEKEKPMEESEAKKLTRTIEEVP